MGLKRSIKWSGYQAQHALRAALGPLMSVPGIRIAGQTKTLVRNAESVTNATRSAVAKGVNTAITVKEGANTAANWGALRFRSLGNAIQNRAVTATDNMVEGVKKGTNQLKEGYEVLKSGLQPKMATTTVHVVSDTGAESFAYREAGESVRLEQWKRVAEGSVGEGSNSINNFTWKLRGKDVTLQNIQTVNIEYIKRNAEELNHLRNEFNRTIRKDFLKNLGENTDYLKNAGFSKTDILKLQNGRVPDGWQVHHKIPLDGGGTNSFDNLVLIKNEPYHKVITNIFKTVFQES